MIAEIKSFRVGNTGDDDMMKLWSVLISGKRFAELGVRIGF